MVNLANQYTKILTYKRRIYYSDFSVLSGTRRDFHFLDLPRTVEIIGAKVWIREKFAATGLTTCNLYFIASTELAQTNESGRSCIIVNALQNVTDFSGSVAFSTHTMNNQSLPTTMVARLITNTISGAIPLTAGYFDVWLMTSKLS